MRILTSKKTSVIKKVIFLFNMIGRDSEVQVTPVCVGAARMRPHLSFQNNPKWNIRGRVAGLQKENDSFHFR